MQEDSWLELGMGLGPPAKALLPLWQLEMSRKPRTGLWAGLRDLSSTGEGGRGLGLGWQDPVG